MVLSLPHEQLLDMNLSSIPTAITAVKTGALAAELPETPTIFDHRHLYDNTKGERRVHTLAWPKLSMPRQ